MSGITKLIFAGLDKAGKTTIYKATMEEMDAKDLKDLAPTKQIERHSTNYLDQDFSVWDMGGQQNYRESYLSKPEVFNQTKAMIFVIDIQDIDRLEESYQYFVDILSILKNVDPAPKLYVLFHKYDPELAGRLKSHFYKAARLFRKADKLTPQKFKFYLTSIFSNSIDLAVKRILFENFEDFDEPSQKLSMKSAKPQADSKSVPQPSGVPTATASTAPSQTPPPSTTISETKTVPQPTTSSAASLTPSAKPPAPPPAANKAPPPATTPEPKTKPAIPPLPTKIAEPRVEEKAVTEEVSKETPPPDMEKVEKKTDKEILEDATPKSLFDLSDSIVEKLTEVIAKRMAESEEIVAISILSQDGEQVLAVGKSDIDYERLGTLKEVVATLNPQQFYKELADIEYRGLGHFTLSDFDIYFARASNEFAIAILAVDVSTLMLQNAQRIVDSIRQGLGTMEISEEAEPDAAPGKKDLVSDLRSRLKKLSGLSDLE
ncbi:MAG: hypothetical protein HeimC2_45280 [Candidatus Heimdallarchaeota archaeon LC_2]|nr:MAG: hypothetical protein HeimC2_45280 [Candidatus Heimdallarchaeota archaeon LC_2]